jgi:hypothetical protein
MVNGPIILWRQLYGNEEEVISIDKSFTLGVKSPSLVSSRLRSTVPTLFGFISFLIERFELADF